MTSRPSAPKRLTTASRLIGQVTVLALTGAIDHDSVGHFAQGLAAIQGPAPKRIVVDFTQVTFMDSTGINVLVSTYRALQGSDGWIRVAGAAEGVLRVIQIVGVDTVIPCYSALEQALEA
ncbi:hypothetical protein B0675_26215 [Streptomyces sp. M41(2017)]|uniref:STAS domain-containing protein n=1 Tax=Streptomyces sp. M41(2017) TaxID=1955065 RepID=UPI0009C118BC|nr:STAS domain-containing protein [Streptomyces sp. M41(2017)]OQQ13750.1 hypothetical protein B0675_26215 [Streptomyces sp. M41(2017)]